MNLARLLDEKYLALFEYVRPLFMIILNEKVPGASEVGVSITPNLLGAPLRHLFVAPAKST